IDRGNQFFKFKDLPRIARECKEYGIREINAWMFFEFFILPLAIDPSMGMGNEADLLKAIKEIRAMGSNLSLFYSIGTLSCADKYGGEVDTKWWEISVPNNDFVPTCKPYYVFPPYPITMPRIGWGGPRNELFFQDMSRELFRWFDLGVYSFCMDQSFADP